VRADSRFSAVQVSFGASHDVNPVAGIFENNNESLSKTKDRKFYSS
jgi:hypothetical protein